MKDKQTGIHTDEQNDGQTQLEQYNVVLTAG